MTGMEYLEIAATVITLACVILGVKRSLWQFPVGIVGTALFFLVVVQRQIYANAALQVFFVFVQVYGWWYWLKGDKGSRPKIRTTNPWLVSAGLGAALAIAGLMSPFLEQWTQTATPLVDASTFTFSVLAQILLDRKRLETWPVWTIVNILSVYLYASQQLWVFTGLYVFFFFNAFWGWWEWRRAMKKEAAPAPAAA
jgi:nicotinamide mononucleotide transporter